MPEAVELVEVIKMTGIAFVAWVGTCVVCLGVLVYAALWPKR